MFLSLHFKYLNSKPDEDGFFDTNVYTDTLDYLVDDTNNVPTVIPPYPYYYSFEGFNHTNVYLVINGKPTSPATADPSNPDITNIYLNYHNYVPLTSWCSAKTAVIMSSGTNSFDTDDIATDLKEPTELAAPPIDLDIDEQTDWVGAAEEISGKYLIGSNGEKNDGQCTPKSLSSLSSAKGTCPDGPNLKGGYQMAGMAHYVRSNDLHKLEYEFINPAFSYSERYWVGDQTISTYSILLSEAARFDITVGDGKVTLMPSCLANANDTADADASGWESCSITDVRVENLEYAQGTKDLISGSFTVTWEDTTEGSDYDMDGYERVAFCVGPTACEDISVSENRLKVTTSVLKRHTNKAMRFGYALSGSGTTDGAHYALLCHPGDTDCIATEATPSTYAKGTDATSAKLLESPLWYAAKYGGFQTLDANNDLTPQAQGQASWDANEDGVPDNFYNATNPLLLADALDKSLTTLASSITSSASAAANSTRLDTSAALYQAKYLPSTWAGHLLAYEIDTSGNSTSILKDEAWDAGAKLADRDYATRHIYSYNESTKQGIEFNHDQLSDASKALLTANELNYIKGDTSNEISISSSSGFLRERLGGYKLGDIVNSDPQFVSNLSRGYDRLPGDDGKEGSDYLKYISSAKFKARPPMLAVGANDGMLHVFNASLDETGGQELFAYVPTSVIGNLKLLTSPQYSIYYNHRYYVDGSPTVSDAYIDTDGNGDKEWRTVLVGSLGAGGKGVFALDITLLDPTDYKTEETFSEGRVLWELNDNLALDADDRAKFYDNLGLTIGQASIARMANGQFAAVFGNGYNSRSQKAVLYIVDLATGNLIREINTGVGSPTSDGVTLPEIVDGFGNEVIENNLVIYGNGNYGSENFWANGLSAPLTVDANGDHIVDAIYAGDYQGNLWKFDVSSNNPVEWDIAKTSNGDKVPLFTAVAEAYNFSVGIQPLNEIDNVTVSGPLSIVAKPVFMQHPKGGVMLYFGTGRYLMGIDLGIFVGWDNGVYLFAAYRQINGFYGIWDNCMSYAGSGGTPCRITPVTKDDLVKQKIVAENGALFQRQTSKNTVTYPDKRGWYLDLAYCDPDPTNFSSLNCGQLYSQERVVSEALIKNQKIIFSTLYLNPSLCEAGGGSWLMSLDALTGKSPETSSFLTTVGGVENTPIPNITVDGQEYAVSGVRSTVGITDTSSVIKTDDGKFKLITSGSKGKTEEHSMLDSHGNRHSWVQIR